MMKIPALLLSAILITVAANCQSENGIDVLHYSFQVNLSDSSDLISGKAGIQLRFTKATDLLSFDLASVKKAARYLDVVPGQSKNQAEQYFKENFIDNGAVMPCG